MPSAFTWSDSDRFSISSSSVCFLSWRSLLFPQCFGHPLGLFTLCHDFILSFCNASSSFLPGLSFCISMLRDVSFRRTPHAHAEDFCTDRLHLDGVKRCGLDTFPGGMVVPVEHYMGMEVRFPYFPANAPRPPPLWMAICTGVTPNLSWNLFPSSCSSSMVVSSFDHDHALTGEVPP